MANVICDTSAAPLQEENAIFLLDVEDTMIQSTKSPLRESTPKKGENAALKTDMNVNQVMNGHHHENLENNDGKKFVSPKMSESPQKGMSPTLIGQAFNVMKNLFSPDKSKSKTPNGMNPVNNQQNSGSPPNGICMPSKMETTPDITITNVTDSSAKKDSFPGSDHLVVTSTIPSEGHDNTDDSFITTASVADDSFQSAVTHIDEPAFSGAKNTSNTLDESQVLSVLNNSNSDTLEISASSLENTMLKNVSFEEIHKEKEFFNKTLEVGENDLDVTKLNEKNLAETLSYLTLKEKNENSEGMLVPNISDEGLNEIIAEKQPSENVNNKDVMIDELKENVNSEHLKKKALSPQEFKKQKINTTQSVENKKKEKLEILQTENKKHKEKTPLKPENTIKEVDIFTNDKDENIQILLESDIVKKEDLSSDFELISENEIQIEPQQIDNITLPENKNELGWDETSENSKMKKIFLNKTFEKSKVEESSVLKEKVTESKAEENAEVLCPEKLENTISTTTIILDTVDSDDFSKMVRSLKQEGCSLTSLDGCSESLSLESMKNDALNKLHPSKDLTDQCSKSLGSSPNRSPRLNRNISKSVDLDLMKTSSKGKKIALENQRSLSSADVRVRHETPEKMLGLHPPSDEKKCDANRELKTILSPLNLNENSEKVKNENSSLLEFGNSQMGLLENEADVVLLPSQQSYTVLCTANETLNRPVISSTENLCIDSGVFDTKSKDSSATFSKDSEILGQKYFNFAYENMNLARSLKQSTPLAESVRKSNNFSDEPVKNTFAKPVPVNIKSSDCKENSSLELNAAKDYSKADLLDKAMKIFSSKESSTGMSPVMPVHDSQSLFESLETGVNNYINNTWALPSKTIIKEKKPLPKAKKQRMSMPSTNVQDPTKHNLNRTYEVRRSFGGIKSDSSVSNKLNQTYDKKTQSPKSHDLNETYNKKLESPSPKLNETYDKKQEASLININQTYELNSESPSVAMEQTFDIATESPLMSQTFTEPQLNQTFEKKVAIVEPTQTLQSIVKKEETEFSFLDNAANETTDALKNACTSKVVSPSLISPIEEEVPENQNMDELVEKFNYINLNNSAGKKIERDLWCDNNSAASTEESDNFSEGKLSFGLKEGDELFQLIQEQFSPTDIEKICSVVDDISACRKLNTQIMRASQQFDKSLHESFSKETEKLEETVDFSTPQGLEFLNSIKGKPTGRDFSRESLYVKFDPLVEGVPKKPIIDLMGDTETLPTIEASPKTDTLAVACDKLISLTPEKQPLEVVTPSSLPVITESENENKNEKEKLINLQKEINLLRKTYAEREKANQVKIDKLETEVAKLTGDICVLEEKHKESQERERLLIKKLQRETDNIKQLKTIMEEYVIVIGKLSDELGILKADSSVHMEELMAECDSVKTHLQNTEAAFVDLIAKYEKCKKTVVSLKANEIMYKNTITEQSVKLEQLEKTYEETKAAQIQEAARLKAQVRKAELNLESLQKNLNRKIKENQKLTAICDEFIEGKKK